MVFLTKAELLMKESKRSDSFVLYVYKDLSNPIHHTGWLVKIVVGGSMQYFTIDFNPDGSKMNALMGTCQEKIHVFKYEGEHDLGTKRCEKPLVRLSRSSCRRFETEIDHILDAILGMKTQGYNLLWNNCRDFVSATMKRVVAVSSETDGVAHRESAQALLTTRMHDTARLAVAGAAVAGLVGTGVYVYNTLSSDDQEDRERPARGR